MAFNRSSNSRGDIFLFEEGSSMCVCVFSLTLCLSSMWHVNTVIANARARRTSTLGTPGPNPWVEVPSSRHRVRRQRPQAQ
jgi:hypothetical protein